jgi:hypothetical protein
MRPKLSTTAFAALAMSSSERAACKHTLTLEGERERERLFQRKVDRLNEYVPWSRLSLPFVNVFGSRHKKPAIDAGVTHPLEETVGFQSVLGSVFEAQMNDGRVSVTTDVNVCLERAEELPKLGRQSSEREESLWPIFF